MGLSDGCSPAGTPWWPAGPRRPGRRPPAPRSSARPAVARSSSAPAAATTCRTTPPPSPTSSSPSPARTCSTLLRQRLAADAPPVGSWELVAAGAEQLPFGDDSFDTVVAVFVHCTVPDPPAALREIARVLRPGGRYLFLEHVRSPRQPRPRRGAGRARAAAHRHRRRLPPQPALRRTAGRLAAAGGRARDRPDAAQLTDRARRPCAAWPPRADSDASGDRQRAHDLAGRLREVERDEVQARRALVEQPLRQLRRLARCRARAPPSGRRPPRRTCSCSCWRERRAGQLLGAGDRVHVRHRHQPGDDRGRRSRPRRPGRAGAGSRRRRRTSG